MNRRYFNDQLCAALFDRRVLVVSADLCELFHNEFLKCHGPFPNPDPLRYSHKATGLSSIQ